MFSINLLCIRRYKVNIQRQTLIFYQNDLKVPIDTITLTQLHYFYFHIYTTSQTVSSHLRIKPKDAHTFSH